MVFFTDHFSPSNMSFMAQLNALSHKYYLWSLKYSILFLRYWQCLSLTCRGHSRHQWQDSVAKHSCISQNIYKLLIKILSWKL